MNTKQMAVVLLAAIAVAGAAEAQSGNFSASVEVPYLQLFANHGVGEGLGGNAWFGDVDQSAAFRAILAYESAGMFGARLSGFRYDAAVTNPNDMFNINTVDLDATMSGQIGSWDVLGFAGVRVANIDWSDEEGGSGYGFSGAGPTVGGRLTHVLGGGFSMNIGARYSLLVGKTTELVGDDYADNTFVPGTELRMGLDYNRAFASGSTLTASFGIEAQLYSSLSGNVDNDIDPEDIDVLLAGPYIAVRFSF